MNNQFENHELKAPVRDSKHNFSKRKFSVWENAYFEAYNFVNIGKYKNFPLIRKILVEELISTISFFAGTPTARGLRYFTLSIKVSF